VRPTLKSRIQNISYFTISIRYFFPTFIPLSGVIKIRQFLVTHLTTGVCERCITSTIARPAHLQFLNLFTYILLTLYLLMGSWDIWDIPPIPTFYQNVVAMRNTSDMIGGKPIAVWSQSISRSIGFQNTYLLYCVLQRRMGYIPPWCRLHVRPGHLGDVQPQQRAHTRVPCASARHGGLQLVPRPERGHHLLRSQLLLQVGTLCFRAAIKNY
jgi:hypothetical protein